ncbi:Ig-like domain-containing protein [Candidatus Curtissbacteria bacterium]|nr:Ig-like domain-containing protein [Candidatus Curtissbacteria bacterium]
MEEKRGPIEKGEKGWPVNPFGVVAVVVFVLVIVFLIARPLFRQKAQGDQNQQTNSPGGRIISPNAGDIIRSGNLPLELSVDSPTDAQKVQFWIKSYADGKWQMVGEDTGSPFKLDWQIPNEYQNKAVAITTHIYQKDGKIVKDPGGWREGIILLSE